MSDGHFRSPLQKSASKKSPPFWKKSTKNPPRYGMAPKCSIRDLKAIILKFTEIFLFYRLAQLIVTVKHILLDIQSYFHTIKSKTHVRNMLKQWALISHSSNKHLDSFLHIFKTSMWRWRQRCQGSLIDSRYNDRNHFLLKLTCSNCSWFIQRKTFVTKEFLKSYYWTAKRGVILNN